MDLSDLLIFKTVADEGGILRAATRLHRVQSNITTRVKQLEESGVIAQYVALLNAKALGQHGTCFSIINLATMNDAFGIPVASLWEAIVAIDRCEPADPMSAAGRRFDAGIEAMSELLELTREMFGATLDGGR